MLACKLCLVLVLVVVAATPCGAQIVPVVMPVGQVPYTGLGLVEVAALLDADADGLQDLVSRTDAPLDLVVQRNLGNGVYGPPIKSSTVAEDVNGTAFADVNGDGVLDAAVGNPNTDNVNVCVLLGDGAGGFALWAAVNNGSLAFPTVALGDLNGDGTVDILSTTSLKLSAQLQLGAGFAMGKLSAIADTVGEPALGDIDLDGFLDVVQVSDSQNAAQAQSDLHVSLGDGTGGFFNVQEGTIDARARRIQIVHLDGDGLPDVLVHGLPGTTSGAGGYYLFRNEGGWFHMMAHEPSALLGTGTQDVVAGDLNGDGCAELVVVRSGGANEVRMNDGAADFPVSVAFSGPVAGVEGLIGDLNADDLPDVGVLDIPAGPTETWHLWLNATAVPGLWTDLGQGLAGTLGVPKLTAAGQLVAQQPISLEVGNTAPSSLIALVVGVQQIDAPFKGGTLVPSPDLILWALPTDASGLSLAGSWPAGIPSGLQIVLQGWVLDAQGPQGFAASNALLTLVP